MDLVYWDRSIAVGKQTGRGRARRGHWGAGAIILWLRRASSQAVIATNLQKHL